MANNPHRRLRRPRLGAPPGRDPNPRIEVRVALDINAPYPCANAGNNLPRNGAGPFREFCAGNFLVSIASHQNNFVAHLHLIDVSYVDNHQIHCYSTEEWAALTAY